MPGAPEPAGTTPTPVGGDVIHLDGRRPARSSTGTSEQGGTVAAHGDPADPETRLAIRIQGLFMDRERTLADPATAKAYDITLTAVALIMDSAQANGGITDADHELLQRMIQTARRVPGILGVHD